MKKIGVVAYKLKLPAYTKVHPVFHASLLKKANSPIVDPQPLPDYMNEEWHLEPNPKKVISSTKNEQGEIEVLVKWKYLPDFENSWESRDKMMTKFPTLLLEDKDSFEGGIGKYGQVYERTCRQKEKERNNT